MHARTAIFEVSSLEVCHLEIERELHPVGRRTHLGQGLLVVGGDTTFAVLQALDVTTVEPCAELLPGVPLSNARFAGRDVAIVTKAGGFGDADMLSRVRQCLERSE